MSKSLALADLSAAVAGHATALRSITKLQPIEGEGGKVFPATYSKGEYATVRHRKTPPRRQRSGTRGRLPTPQFRPIRSEPR
jgi:hypothetical protein